MTIDRVGKNIKEGYEKIKKLKEKVLSSSYNLQDLYINIITELNEIEYLKTLDPGEEVNLNQCKDICKKLLTDEQKNVNIINKLRFRIYTNTIILYEMNNIFDRYFNELDKLSESELNSNRINLCETIITESSKYLIIFKKLDNYENVIRQKDAESRTNLLKLIEPNNGTIIEYIYLIKLENIKYNSNNENNDNYKSIIKKDISFKSKIIELEKLKEFSGTYELENFTETYNIDNLNNIESGLDMDYSTYKNMDIENNDNMDKISQKYIEYFDEFNELKTKLENIREEIYNKKIEGKKLNMTPEQIIDRYQKSIFNMYDFSNKTD